jgi:hypothetical protein
MVSSKVEDGGKRVLRKSAPAVLLPARVPFGLSAALAVVAIAGAGSSLFVPSLLTGVAAANGNLRGTALIMLCAGVPALIAAMTLTARGSARGLVLWLGSLGYLTYQAVMFCFATPLNNLFLLYVAQLGLAFWSLVVLLRHTDLGGFGSRISPMMPAKWISGIAAAIVVLNATAWLMRIIPAVFSAEPASLLVGSGLLTNPVYVQDLAIWLPVFAVAAVAGWQRRTWGLLVIGGMLVMTFLESIGIAVDQWFGSMADPYSPISSLTMTPVFAALAVAVAAPLLWYLRNLDRIL